MKMKRSLSIWTAAYRVLVVLSVECLKGPHLGLCYSLSTRYTLTSSFSHLVYNTTPAPTITKFTYVSVWVCLFKDQSHWLYRCCRQVDGIQSTDVKSVKIRVYVTSLTSPGFGARSISICTSRRLSRRIISRDVPRCFLRCYNVDKRWHQQTRPVASYYQLRRIKSNRHALPTTTAIQVVNSFIISRVDYCNSILAGIQKYQLDRLQSNLNVVTADMTTSPQFWETGYTDGGFLSSLISSGKWMNEWMH